MFRSENGEREYQMSQVARVYMGTYPFASITGKAGAAANDLDPGLDSPGSVRVSATAGWVSTGMRVRLR